MKIQRLAIPDVILFTPRAYQDDRGIFMETFRSSVFEEAVGVRTEFVQDNCSRSIKPGTLRGLHFQTPPMAQGKLLTCSQGAILDVAVDIRKDSQTYGQYVYAEMHADTGQHIWVPPGFMHGFVTREPNTEVRYKCTQYFSAAHGGAVKWDDPDLAIEWDLTDTPILSGNDKTAPRFADLESPF